MIGNFILQFISIFLGRTPNVRCYQIGDNQYDCQGYWTD